MIGADLQGFYAARVFLVGLGRVAEVTSAGSETPCGTCASASVNWRVYATEDGPCSGVRRCLACAGPDTSASHRGARAHWVSQRAAGHGFPSVAPNDRAAVD